VWLTLKKKRVREPLEGKYLGEGERAIRISGNWRGGDNIQQYAGHRPRSEEVQNPHLAPPNCPRSYGPDYCAISLDFRSKAEGGHRSNEKGREKRSNIYSLRIHVLPTMLSAVTNNNHFFGLMEAKRHDRFKQTRRTNTH
jgi:hypothetical protein